MINWGNFGNFFNTGIPAGVLYPSLLLTALLVLLGLLTKRINNKKKYVLWVLLVEYLFVVVCSTIICRGPGIYEFERIELKPFWTYTEVIKHTPGVSVWDIVLNMVMFMPLGFLVKLLYPYLSTIKIIFVAIGCSLCIEANQLIFEKGVAQLDDVMHNAIGAYIGWLLAKIAMQWKSKRESITSS